MTVNCGPLMLRKVVALVISTRVGPWPPFLCPTLYTPLVTSTVSPALEASNASWMFVAAVAQVA
jgi:hypothetical protein